MPEVSFMHHLPSILLIISSLKMKVNFVVRRTKKKVDGTVPIEMTISVKGKRRYVSTGREVKPSDFSPKTQTVRGDKELNDFLKALKARLYAIETTLMSKGVNVSIEAVLDVFRNGEQERKLGHEKPEEGRDNHLPDVFLMDMLMRSREQGPQPEKGRRSEGTQAEERHRCNIPIQGDALAADDVEPENGVGREARQVADERALSFLIHLVIRKRPRSYTFFAIFG